MSILTAPLPAITRLPAVRFFNGSPFLPNASVFHPFFHVCLLFKNGPLSSVFELFYAIFFVRIFGDFSWSLLLTSHRRKRKFGNFDKIEDCLIEEPNIGPAKKLANDEVLKICLVAHGFYVSLLKNLFHYFH